MIASRLNVSSYLPVLLITEINASRTFGSDARFDRNFRANILTPSATENFFRAAHIIMSSTDSPSVILQRSSNFLIYRILAI